MSKSNHLFSLAALLLLATACSKSGEAPPPPPPPPINSVLPNVPVPPQGIALSQESGADATQITFTTPIKPDSINQHYRRVLAEAPFRLVSEMTQNETTIFMAEQDGPMIWVTVKSNGDGGSAVTIAGGAELPKGDSGKKGGVKK